MFSVIPCVAFGHGACSNRLFTGGWDSVIKVWNVATGDCVKELDYHQERIADLCVSPDGKWLVSSSADKNILLYAIEEDYKPIARYYCNDECKCVCIVGDEIAAGYASGVIRLWPLYKEGYISYFQNKECHI